MVSFWLFVSTLIITSAQLYVYNEDFEVSHSNADDMCLFYYDRNLASLHSDTQHQEADNLITDEAWIGLHDYVTEGTWIWTDNTPFDYGTTDKQPPWKSDQPNNDGNQDCVRMKSGEWNDKDCDTSYKSLCGYPTPTTVISETMRIREDGKIIGNIDILDEIYVEFDITLTSWPSQWGNILHCGNTANKRYPAIYINGQDKYIHSRFSIIDNWNSGANTADNSIQLNTEYHITMYQTQRHLKITVDGVTIHDADTASGHAIVMNQNIYLSDPWTDSFAATIRGLQIKTENSPISRYWNYICDWDDRWTTNSGGSYSYGSVDGDCSIQQSDDTNGIGRVAWMGVNDPTSLLWTDYKIEFKMNLLTGSGCGPIFRANNADCDASNCGQYYFLRFSTSSFRLNKFDDSYQNLYETSISHSYNTTYYIRVEVTGNTFKIYENNEYLETFTDSSYSSGSVGFRTYNADCRISRIRITFPTDQQWYTASPTSSPTPSPTTDPTKVPSPAPTDIPTPAPTDLPTAAPSVSPSFSPTGAPTQNIRIIDRVWYDDFTDNEKPYEFDNGDIGWLIYAGAYDAPTASNHMYSGLPITGSRDKLGTGIISTKTSNLVNYPGQLFHGAFWRKMTADNDNRVNIRRNFYCKFQSFLTVTYDLWYCNGNSNFIHNLFVNRSETSIKTFALLETNSGNTLPTITDTNLLSCKGGGHNAKLIHFIWNGNYSIKDTEDFEVLFTFDMDSDDAWFMLHNITIYCDLEYPSLAPTQAPSQPPSIAPTQPPSIAPTQPPTQSPTDSTSSPSLAPSLAPTQPPSLAPTQPPSLAPSHAPSLAPSLAPSIAPSLAPSLAPSDSPTYCPDFGLNYTEIDGLDITVDPRDYINYVQMKSNSTINKTSDDSDDTYRRTDIYCTNPNGCELHCDHVAGCVSSTYYCESQVGCNVYCTKLASCNKMVISANKYNTTSITIECDGLAACEEARINLDGINQGEIHCISEQACEDINITFANISSRNNTNTSVSCYETDACVGARIQADGPFTRLHMYDHSGNVILNNGYGHDPFIETVTCGTDIKYIKYEKAGQFDIYAAVKQEYESNKAACDDVIVQCPETNNTNKNCSMKYLFGSIDDTDVRYDGAQCMWVLLSDITQLECAGNCLQAPTEAPTPAPSNNPSFSPSAAPSSAPTSPPTTAPSYSPSLNPSLAPTNAPTKAPTTPPTAAPTYLPTNAPTNAPTLAPTTAPTYSPTQAPTRNPTNNFKRLYDSWTDIVYIFRNLTDENCDWILNDSMNSAVSYLQEDIEMGYFHFKLGQLESYMDFAVRAELLNQVDYKDTALFTKELLYNKTNWKGTREMHMKSKISYKFELGGYLISTSQSSEWSEEMTKHFRKNLNNSFLNFSVSNSSGLFRDFTVVDTNEEITFYTLTGFLGLCVIIGVIAKIHNSRNWGTGNRKGCVPVDNANWLAVIIYGLQIYDIFSDIALTHEIYIAIFNDLADDGNTVDDDPDSIDTMKEYMLVVSGIMSLCFLLIPYGLNIAYAAKLPSTQVIIRNNSARSWFEQYQSLFIALVVISGGCYPALHLISSNIFGIAIFNAGLSSFELSGLSDIRVMTTVVTENGPQLLVQIGYSFATGGISQNTILAFSTSVMSIIASILNFAINRDKKGAVFDIFYYLEIKKSKGKELDKLTKVEKVHIKRQKGIKLALAKNIIKLYGDIDIAHFEIGYVTIRNDNFVIRVCQHLHEQDLAFDLSTVQPSSDPLKPFKNHCYELFAANREDIENILFAHYYQLNREIFEVLYHRDYPTEQNINKLLHGKQKSANIRALIDAAEFNRSLSMNEGEEQKSKTGILPNYRTETKKAFEILLPLIKKYKKKNPNEEKVSHRQMNEWKCKLQEHCIPHAVIDDVMEVAKDSLLIKQQSYCLSDIDTPDDSQELFEIDAEYKETQKKTKMSQAIHSEIQMWPKWFTTKEPVSPHGSPDEKGEYERTNNLDDISTIGKKKKKKKDKNNKKAKKKKKKKKGKLKKQIELSTIPSAFKYQLSDSHSDDDVDFAIEKQLDEWANE